EHAASGRGPGAAAGAGDAGARAAAQGPRRLRGDPGAASTQHPRAHPDRRRPPPPRPVRGRLLAAVHRRRLPGSGAGADARGGAAAGGRGDLPAGGRRRDADGTATARRFSEGRSLMPGLLGRRTPVTTALLVLIAIIFLADLATGSLLLEL